MIKMSQFLNLFIYPNLHPAQGSEVFVRQFERGVRCIALRAFLSLVRAQANLQTQGQLHLIARLAQSLDGVCDLRRVLDRGVDGRANLLHNLFSCVVNLQKKSPSGKPRAGSR